MPFILRRLLFYVVAAWVALTINFFIPRAMPGNAVQSVMSKFTNLQPAAYKALQALKTRPESAPRWERRLQRRSEYVESQGQLGELPHRQNH